MNCELLSLKVAYEEQGMSPETIAEDRDLDIIAVKAGLCQISPKYRKDAAIEGDSEDGLNFTNDELRSVNETILSLAVGAEDEATRLRAAIYVRDDKKGRKEIMRAVQQNTFNILDFNSMQKSAREQANRIRQSVQPQKTINV